MSRSSMVGTDDDYPQLPDDAFEDNYRQDVNNEWLVAATEAEQVAAMVQWFLRRFWDPANDTPYMSSEGGYIWVHGGPYDATEQLEARFGDVASEEAIREAVDRVEEDEIGRAHV